MTPVIAIDCPSRGRDRYRAPFAPSVIDFPRPSEFFVTRSDDKLRVLLVEDNPGDVDLVRVYLAQELGRSIELSCAASLAAARGSADLENLDLVLLDLGLPDGTGVEVVAEMRRMAADVPIVVLTGQDDPESGLDALKRDAQDYLVKDQLSGSMLRRSIHYAIERSRWQQQHRHQLSINPDGILVVDEGGTVRFTNAAAVELLGNQPSCETDLPPEIRSSGAAGRDIELETGRIVEVRSVQTEWQDQCARLIALRDTTDRHRAEEALNRLTEELQRTNARLEELVSSDPLTEVLNRRGMEHALTVEIERMRRSGDPMSALLVDCDDFKGINDTHGHAVGDAALRALTQSVAGVLRAGDHFARVGGDEFLVLLPGASLAEGMSVAEKLRQAIKATTLPVAEGSFQLSGSLAVGTVTAQMVSIEQILAAVNAALKRSKADGKDRVSAQGVDGETVFVDGREGRQELDVEAVKLGVALQPIRRVDSGQIVAVEAFTRGPVGCFATPDDLFRAAYELDALTALDLRALSASLERIEQVDSEHRFHVNVFPSTLLNTPVAEVVKLVNRSRNGRSFCLELSEQRFLGDPLHLREPVLALRESGIAIAIDGVGYGRSSVEALLALEPEVVKIDRRALQATSGQTGGRRQFERLLAMLSAVGTEVVVEGVESEEELSVLRALGVEFAQGYLWDRPDEDPHGSSLGYETSFPSVQP